MKEKLKEALARFIVWGLIIAFLVALYLSPRSDGDGCSEYYAGYDTGWSDVCVDDYGG